jgi:3-hydroxyisobutyrate dehydrogenase/2-hydroxy-3-oxopropionate reductase
MTTVGVVGLGAMGSRIASRLHEAGYALVVWNRSRERMDPLVALGAAAAETPAEVAGSVEILLTMVANPEALRAVSEGPDGVAAGAGASLTVIEMSTSGPAAVARLRTMLPERVELIDAPVLGSLTEVEEGSLRIFVGGPRPLVERCLPVLSALGTPLHVGPLGSGAAAKLVANLTLVGVAGLLGEALALAARLGLQRDTAFDVLGTTALAAQAERRRAAVESGEYPPRFSLSLARKDAELISAASDLDLRIAEAARTWLAEAEDGGWGALDYSAVIAHIVAANR